MSANGIVASPAMYFSALYRIAFDIAGRSIVR